VPSVTSSLPTINETTEADVSESSKESGINLALQRRNVALSNLCHQGKYQEISRQAWNASAICIAQVVQINSMKQPKIRAQWEQLPLKRTKVMTKAARVQWELNYAQTAELPVQASRVEIVDVHYIAANRAKLSIGLKGAISSFACQSSLKMKSKQHRNRRHKLHFTQSRILWTLSVKVSTRIRFTLQHSGQLKLLQSKYQGLHPRQGVNRE
jgi:hypothetical protein